MFRTTFSEDEKWATLRQRWDRIVVDRLKNYDGVSGVDEAGRLLRFHWVENPELGGAGPAMVAACVNDFNTSGLILTLRLLSLPFSYHFLFYYCHYHLTSNTIALLVGTARCTCRKVYHTPFLSL